MRRFVSVAMMQFVSLVALWLITIPEATFGDIIEENYIQLKRPLAHVTNFMLKELACEANVGKNFVFSPLAIHLLMSLELAAFPNDTGPIREALNYDSSVTAGDVFMIHESYSKISSQLEWKMEMEQGEKPGVDPPFAFDILTKIVNKNNATIDQLFTTSNLYGISIKYLNVSVANVSDNEPASKRKLLEEVAGWANRTGFENPILTEKDLDGDFKHLLLAITHIKSLWLDPFALKTKRGAFWNGGREDMEQEVEYLLNYDVETGSRLLFFKTDGLGVSWGDILDKKYLRKYMKKDLWAKYSKWQFMALKLALRFDFSLSILVPTNEPNNTFKVDEMIHKLILNLSSDKYALSHILDELDSDELPPSFLKEVEIPKFSFEYDLEFDQVHSKVRKPNATKPGVAKLRAGFEITREGLRGAGSGHHIEKRSAREFSPPEEASISQPFLFIVRYKKVILLCGKVTKLNGQSYKLPPD